MNISYLKNKNIHFVECKNWHDAYGYEKSEMKEDTIKYIEQLQQENKILKENAEHNDKVVDKVNWENMLLKKENQELKKIINQIGFEPDEIAFLQQDNAELKKQLEEYKNPIKYFKYANKNVTEENKQLKDNWNKLKQKMIDSFNESQDVQFLDVLQDMQELEQGRDNK